MRIVLATPLYPPEIADAATYAKELARRLAKQHQVTVLAYTHLPEQVSGVTVVVIEKRQSRVARLWAFRKALARVSSTADAVIAINGISIEVPLLFTLLPRTILCVADTTAYERANIVERLAAFRVTAVVRDVPGPKPEILPLEQEPEAATAAWDRAWDVHLQKIGQLLNHGN